MLPNELAGKLFKHIYSYVNDENPVNDNPMINLAFEPIKLQLKRDLIKWLDTKEGRSKAGKASAEARRNKNEQELTNLTNVDFVEQTLTNPTVNVNDNVNVINKEIDFVIFLDWFNKTTNRNFKSIPEATKKSFKARIKEGYTKEDICKAVINCSKDKFHIENPKYLTPEFISRADKLALYLSAPTETKTKIIIY